MSDIAEKFFREQPKIISFTDLEYDNIYSQKAHQSVSHELMYVLAGKVTLRFDNLKFHAMPGDFLLLPEHTIHRDEFAPLKGLRILLIEFRWNCSDYFHVVSNRSLLDLSYNVRSEARRRLDFMRENWDNTAAGWLNGSLQLHSLLMLFFQDLVQSVPPDNRAETSLQLTALRRAKHYMEQNFAETITLRSTADYVNMSPAYLSRSFHAEFGICFSEYLTSLRLESARQLLQSSQLQINEIAIRCGFSSTSYFIKIFNSRFGTTPKNYAAGRQKS